MSPLWLPCRGMRSGPVKDRAAGDLIFMHNKTNANLLSVAVRVQHDRVLALALTAWPDWGHQTGDLIEFLHSNTLAGFSPLPGTFQLEVDAGAKPAAVLFSRDAGGYVTFVNSEVSMMGVIDPGDLRNRAAIAFDPSTWGERRPISEGQASHFTTWRFRLQLSEREAVTVVEGPPPVGPGFA